MCFKKKNYIFEEDLYKNNQASLFSESDYVDNDEARLNPFIHPGSQNKSIEDFAVKYRHHLFLKYEEVYLGSVLRNEFIKKKKKWKTFKKYLVKTRNDYQQNVKDLLEKQESNKIVYNTFKMTKLSKRVKSFLLSILLLNCLITFIIAKWFKPLFNNYLILIPVIIGYLLILLFVLYLIFHKKKIYDINNVQKRYINKLNKYFKNEKKLFKKFYRKIYNYYHRNIYSGYLFYESLDFNDFWNDKISFEKALKNSENIEKNITIIVKAQNRFKVIKKVAIILNVINIIVLLITLVLNLF